MAKREGKAAKKYARALFDLAAKERQGAAVESVIRNLDALVAGLREVATLWSAQESLQSVLSNPAIFIESREAIVRDIAARVIPGSETFSNFLALLLQNKRFSYIEEIATIFSAMVDGFKKLLSLEITSAFEISSNEKQTLQTNIQEQLGYLGSSSSISWNVDPTLLGGLTIKIGDQLLDSSVRGSLEKIRAGVF